MSCCQNRPPLRSYCLQLGLPPPMAPSAAQMAVIAAAVGVAPDEALAARWSSVASAWASV